MKYPVKLLVFVAVVMSARFASAQIDPPDQCECHRVFEPAVVLEKISSDPDVCQQIVLPPSEKCVCFAGGPELCNIFSGEYLDFVAFNVVPDQCGIFTAYHARCPEDDIIIGIK
mmetsp:Transcript_12950/g.28213  ORF Transcript_12950/g.28213 Transcript_12950/m.28213 type:complete len:114 (+) Transcript_12950:45-386(+)